MKKRQLPKTTWLALVLVMGGLLAGSGAGLAWSRAAPAELVEEYTAYEYKQEAEIDYRVHLLPNELFEEEVLGPGWAYLTRLTDYLTVELHYRFEGEREAEIEITCSSTAYLTALTGRGEEKHVAWEREYELLPPQEFSTEGVELVIHEAVEVPFTEYRRFAEEVREETGFSPGELNLLVEFLVEVQAQTDSGLIEKRLTPGMLVPMRGDAFVVEGDLVDRNSAGITGTREVSLPHVGQARTGFAVSTAVFGGALAAFLLLTAPVKQKAKPQDRKAFRLLKKHGERIAALADVAPAGWEKALLVSTFKDLLKVADELQKPVFYYQLRWDAYSEHLFLVLDEEIMYRYSIKT